MWSWVKKCVKLAQCDGLCDSGQATCSLQAPVCSFIHWGKHAPVCREAEQDGAQRNEEKGNRFRRAGAKQGLGPPIFPTHPWEQRLGLISPQADQNSRQGMP